MSDRTERQLDAERAVRRGELREALEIYQALLEDDATDEAAQHRLDAIRSLLQPQELANGLTERAAPGFDLSKPLTLEQTAEALFEQGDLAGAIAAYEHILQSRPDHDLARERYDELKELYALNPKAPPPPELPQSRPELLEALLSRIASRRKS